MCKKKKGVKGLVRTEISEADGSARQGEERSAKEK